MEQKKTNVPHTTVSRDMVRLSQDTGNIYETVMIIAARSKQIQQQMKMELHSKLEEFATLGDDLQEVQENSEQAELSRHYERLPKPTLVAAKEYEDGELHFHISEEKHKSKLG